MAVETGSLRAKYQRLIDAAHTKGVSNLHIRQEEGVLYIDGTAPNVETKSELWDIYSQIDPDFRAGDLILNINSFGNDNEIEEYTVVEGDNLTRIGKQYGLSWQEIFAVNKDIIKDPDLIQPGWKLKIPRK